MKLSQRFQEFIYAVSTSDKYSEFDYRKSFNRLNGPDAQQSLLYSENNVSTSDLNSERYRNFDGVHEVKLAWRHIKNWGDKNYPELISSLHGKCTNNDIDDFQKDLNVQLPNCVSEFFKLTDGQSNLGYDNFDTGLIFGLKLMSLDAIMIEANNWRTVSKYLNSDLENFKSKKVNQISKVPMSHYTNDSTTQLKNSSLDRVSGSLNNSIDLGRSSRSSSISSLRSRESDTTRSSLAAINSTNIVSGSKPIPQQRSIPPGTVNDIFAHPMWIPLVTDGVGNYVGIDLAPPKGGKWGQVILFGRDFDMKFRVADNWGDFLLIFANDLEIGNWDIKLSKNDTEANLMVGSTGELVYKEKGTNNEAPYLDILKKRCINKWIMKLEDGKDQTEEDKHLVEQLKQPNSVVNMKSLISTDESIIKNLNLINDMSSAKQGEEES